MMMNTHDQTTTTNNSNNQSTTTTDNQKNTNSACNNSIMNNIPQQQQEQGGNAAAIIPSLATSSSSASSNTDSNEIITESQQVTCCGGVPPQDSGKTYSTIACLLCRKAHRKCDRLYPVCSECNCRGLADKCAYQQPKKRGPKNANTNLTTNTPPLTKIPPSFANHHPNTTMSSSNNTISLGNISRASPARKNTVTSSNSGSTINSSVNNNNYGGEPTINHHQQQHYLSTSNNNNEPTQQQLQSFDGPILHNDYPNLGTTNSYQPPSSSSQPPHHHHHQQAQQHHHQQHVGDYPSYSYGSNTNNYGNSYPSHSMESMNYSNNTYETNNNNNNGSNNGHSSSSRQALQHHSRQQHPYSAESSPYNHSNNHNHHHHNHHNYRYNPYPSTHPPTHPPPPPSITTNHHSTNNSNTSTSPPLPPDRYISKRELATSLSMLRNVNSFEGFDIDVHSSHILDLYFNRYIMGYPLIKREDLDDIVSRRLSRQIRHIPPMIDFKDEYFICSFYCICMLVFQRIGKKVVAHSFYRMANEICSRLLFYEEEDTPENVNRVGLNFELCMIVSLLCMYSIGNGDFKKGSIYYNIGMSFIQQVNLFGESERGFLIAYYGFCELMLFNETRDQIKCFSIIVNKHVKGNLNFIHNSHFQTLDSCLDVLQILQDKQKNLIQPKNFDIPEGYESVLQNRFDIINSHFDFLRLGLEIKAIMTFSSASSLNYYDEKQKQLADCILNLTSTPAFEDASALIVEPVVLACRIILKYTESYYDPNSVRACLLSMHSLDKRFSSVRKVYGQVFDSIENRYLSYNSTSSK